MRTGTLQVGMRGGVPPEREVAADAKPSIGIPYGSHPCCTVYITLGASLNMTSRISGGALEFVQYKLSLSPITSDVD